MLCPETWSFKPPPSEFKIEKIESSASSTVAGKINNFHFNHLISFVVPDTWNIPKSLSDALVNDSEYYKICNLDASELVNATFADGFVKSGTLTLLSVNTRIDCDDCLAVTPGRKLVLSLNKESYETSGLEGSVSHFCTVTRYKYIVKIDLASLHSTTKRFRRTCECLKRLGKFDVILTWEPHKTNVCPSSIAKYFDTLGYDVKLCLPKHDSQVRCSIKTPRIETGNCDYPDDWAEYVEWLGMVALNADLESGSPADFITTYEVPEPNAVFGQVRVITWRGLFSCKKIEMFFDRLRNYQRENDKPWMALYVQGFSDSPVNWGEREHHYYTNGDNSYVVFVGSDKCIVCSSLTSYKRYGKKSKSKK